MAHDPDWDDSPPMDLDELYRADPSEVIVVGPLMLDMMDEYIDVVLGSENFLRGVFEPGVFSLPSGGFSRLVSILRACSKELLDKVLALLDRRIDADLITTIVSACISISIKLLGAHDWIYDDAIFPLLEDEAEFAKYPLDRTRLGLMEQDILSKTNWKGCSAVLDLDRIYDDLFIEDVKHNELTEEDYKKMIRKTIEMKSEYESGLEENYGITPDVYVFDLILDDATNQWYLISQGGQALDNETVAELELPEATVTVTSKLLRDISNRKGLDIGKSWEWIKDRVLKRGFNLENVTLDLD